MSSRPQTLLRLQFLAMVVLFGLAWPAVGQDYRARVRGVVTDSSQAVVPGARVLLRNTETGVEVVREADASGQYLFDFVDPGTYTLLCEHAGFSRFVQEKLAVQVRGDISLDVTLRVGQASETVTVSETPVAVQFNSSTLEMVVDRSLSTHPEIAFNACSHSASRRLPMPCRRYSGSTPNVAIHARSSCRFCSASESSPASMRVTPRSCVRPPAGGAPPRGRRRGARRSRKRISQDKRLPQCKLC